MPTTTNYIWDEDNLLAEADGSSTIQTVYTNEPEQYGNLISTRLPVAGTPTTVYHHFDALGSTRQLTNAAGSVSDSVIYDAWGNVVTRSGMTPTSMRWIAEVGYYFDPETGLLSVRRRPYGPVISRWTTVDPLAPLHGPTPFTYAYNNPIVSTDPSGMLGTQLLAPLVQNCGFLCLPIHWTLDETEENGFIIQKISVSVVAKLCAEELYFYYPKCSGTADLRPGPDASLSRTLQYYELWLVKGGVLYDNKTVVSSGKHAHDRVGICIGDPCSFSQRTYHVKAEAAFFPVDHPPGDWGAPPGGWDEWQEGGVPAAGKLFSVCADALEIEFAPTVTREVFYAWYCCNQICLGSVSGSDNQHAFKVYQLRGCRTGPCRDCREQPS
jgi:RHS repeat-associated protein